jgi:hypothetical protein
MMRVRGRIRVGVGNKVRDRVRVRVSAMVTTSSARRLPYKRLILLSLH